MAKEVDAIVTATPKHIESVRKKIEEIKKSISGRFFDLGELLKEIRDGGYHMTWGFANFGEWLDTSGLDLKERSAYYLIKIIEMGAALNIPREKLESVKISKLREIAGLDPKTDGKKIKKLIDACVPNKDGNEMSLEDVRQNVARVRAGDDKIETFVFMTIKVTKTCKEEVIDPAIELIRAQHGDTVDSSGAPQEISPGRAIELILTDYLAGADDAPVAREEAPLPVEGQPALPAAPDEVVVRLEAAAEFEDFDTKPETIPDAEVVDDLLAIDEAAAQAESVLKITSDNVKVIPLDTNGEVVAEAPAPPSAVDAAVADCRARIAATNAKIDGSEEEDDPLLDDAVKILKINDHATPNSFKLTFRIGELRAFKLYKQAKSKVK